MKKIRMFVLVLSLMFAFSAFVYAKTLDTRVSTANPQSNDAASSMSGKEVAEIAANPAESSNANTASIVAVSNDDSNAKLSEGASTSSAASGNVAPNTSKTVKTSGAAVSVSYKISGTESTLGAQAVPESNGQLFDTSCTGIGLLRVNYTNNSGKRIKLSVAKGGTTYYYNLQAKGITEPFSLQMGSGQYILSILQNISGSSYQTVESRTIDVNINSPLKVYLNSIQNVNFNSSMAAIIKARALTRGMTSSTNKINAIYNFVISNIHYDKNKLSRVSTDYLPSIDSTYESRSGICYDYASLFAAMLRGVGVPAKLVKGYTPNAQGYHAWNEVYYNGRWAVIDTTYDAEMRALNYRTSMIKNSSKYSKSKEY